MAIACPLKREKMKQKEQEKQTAENKKQTETCPKLAKQALHIAKAPTQIINHTQCTHPY